MEKRNRIAIVVQRYGLEVNGGAEFHARILAEKLADKNDLTILTTTAIDYNGWENHYNSGEQLVNGLKVLRFPTINKKNKKTRAARRAILGRKKYFKVLKALHIFEPLNKLFNLSKVNPQQITTWLAGQGPYCPDLVTYIKENKENYDVFIFFTYLYYPTVVGMPLVAEKSLFIPTAHNEPLLFTKPYEHLFSVPKFIMYNTESEKNLVEKHFPDHTKNRDIAGVGIDKFEGEDEELPHNILRKKYFIYIGRIDAAKGCDELLLNFVEFTKRSGNKDYKLVMVGKNQLKNSPKNPAIIYMGFVSENLKYTLLRNSLALIIPSYYESLSMVTLEAMKEKIPVIANERCEVLNDHIVKSKTGKAYSGQKDFIEALESYIHKSANDLKDEGEKAAKYVTENYSWQTVLDKFERSFEFIKN